jgi:hypothetical protein
LRDVGLLSLRFTTKLLSQFVAFFFCLKVATLALIVLLSQLSEFSLKRADMFNLRLVLGYLLLQVTHERLSGLLTLLVLGLQGLQSRTAMSILVLWLLICFVLNCGTFLDSEVAVLLSHIVDLLAERKDGLA